jgi:cysteine desulfurase / selenocysteine lyase
MNTIRKDFPFFSSASPLLYLDSAATTQKPQHVIDALAHFYAYQNAPVHRGVYALAELATELYESARHTVAQYIEAFDDEVIFTKGTTEGINFIASTWATAYLQPGDEIIISELEHHSNIVPWIRLSETKGVKLKYIAIKQDGTLNYDHYLSLLNPKTKLVSCTASSNAIGTYIDTGFIVKHAHEVGAKVLIDAAQVAGRERISIPKLKPDFLVFSGHKMLAPTGIGVLYIARELHQSIEPYQVGGGMVFSVDFHKATWLKPPRKYEAGTPPIAEAVGLAAAVNYLQKHVSFEALKIHEAQLCTRLLDGLRQMPSVRILSPLEQTIEKGHMVTFVSDTMHAHDIAAYLDQFGICVRAGNHCAQPLHKRLGVESSVRVSFYMYNTIEEVDTLVTALNKLAS